MIMFNKILSTVSIAAVSAVVLIGASVSANAALLASYEFTDVDANNIHDTTLSVDPLVPTYMVGSTLFGAIDHTWQFNVTAPAPNPMLQIAVGYDVDKTNPLDPSSFGIANLTFDWNDGQSAITFTDGSGNLLSNALNDPRLVASAAGAPEVWYFSALSTTQTGTLHVTGTTLGSGGAYSVEISAVPLPPAALLFGTALFGIAALRRRKNKKAMDLAV